MKDRSPFPPAHEFSLDVRMPLRDSAPRVTGKDYEPSEEEKDDPSGCIPLLVPVGLGLFGWASWHVVGLLADFGF